MRTVLRRWAMVSVVQPLPAEQRYEKEIRVLGVCKIVKFDVRLPAQR
jgi:hypothetical protein